MLTRILKLWMAFAAVCVLALPVNAQLRLTGANTYMAHDDGSIWWGVNNTLGNNIVNYYNLYLFTGSMYAPNWLNSGDSDDSLNPNITLSPGTYTIQFTGDAMNWDKLGLNLYFNNDNNHPRITAFTPRDGNGFFQVVPDGITTFGQLGSVLSSGSLTYTFNNLIVELTDLRYSAPGLDLVGPYWNSPGGFSTEDAIGSFTLRVRSGPLPTVSGIVALEGSVGRKAEPLFFVFQPIEGGNALLRSLALSEDGRFQLVDIPNNRYNLWIKGTKWLAKSVVVDTRQGDVLNLDVTLRAGDANNDNFVDVFDLDALITAFDSTPGDTHWNSGADLNGDDAVDTLDLDLLILNFDLVGDF